MKNLKPFGPSIGKTKISKKFLDLLNKEIDNNILTKNNDYSYNHYFLLKYYYQFLYLINPKIFLRF